MEKSLHRKETSFRSLGYFIRLFNERAITQLITPALGKIAHDGKKYTLKHTEFDLLRHARFCIRTDGRMSIRLEENMGYKKHYAVNSENHDIYEAEFRHLAKVLQLEFAADTVFDIEMIFIPESTDKLKALGLHINETNLEIQAATLKQRKALKISIGGNPLTLLGKRSSTAEHRKLSEMEPMTLS